jgi:hypothetical protein
MADKGASETFSGVLVSGQIQTILGDVVGRDKITLGNPEFEDKILRFVESETTSKTARSTLAMNLVALRLATVFVDQMRLLYITSGPRLTRANASLRAHFIERAEMDTDRLKTYIEMYCSQLSAGFLGSVDAVQQRCARTFTVFAGAHPLYRDRASIFREMATAARPMYEVLQAADGQTIASTVEVVNDIGTSLQDLHPRARGFSYVDEIGMLRFAIQTEALMRLQRGALSQIFTIDEDVDSRFSPLYAVIDRWLFEHCEPWA